MAVQRSNNAQSRNNIQMVDAKGEFNPEVQKFLQGLSDTQVTVISIIGPQTGGKSYLLNKLFGTDFTVNSTDWGQTTKGIWIAKCRKDPSIIIIDIEGSDSKDQAKQGSTFENQAALFALKVSNVVILNLQIVALAQYSGSCTPLLSTVFRERMKLGAGKTNVVVALRDSSLRDIASSREAAVKGMSEIWESVHSPNHRLEDYMEVFVAEFPYFEKEESFDNKCTELWNQLKPGGPIGRRDFTHSAHAFPETAKKIWELIRKNEDLHMPSINALTAEHKCTKIMRAKLELLMSSAELTALEKLDKSTSFDSFQKELNKVDHSLQKNILDAFDRDASGYDRPVTERYKQELTETVKVTARKVAEKKCKDILKNKIGPTEREMYKEKAYALLLHNKKTLFTSILKFDRKAFRRDFNVDTIIDLVMKEVETIFNGCPEDFNDLVEKKKSKLKEWLKAYTEEEADKLEKAHKRKVQSTWTMTFISVASTGLSVSGVAIGLGGLAALHATASFVAVFF